MNYNKLIENLEEKIMGKIINILLDKGFELKIDSDGYITVYDPETLSEKGVTYAIGWIKLKRDSDLDLIVDYSTNLEGFLKPVLDYCAQYY